MSSKRHKHHVYVEADREITLNVGDARNERWFKVFHAIVESGIWARLTPSAAKVLVVLAKHADGDWMAWPKVPTIARLSGLADRNVYRAVQQLRSDGLLIVRESGRGRASNVYQLLPPKPDVSVRSDLAAVSGQKCHQRQVRPDTSVNPYLSPEQDSLNNNNIDVVDTLIEAEIAEPTRSRMAALEGITAELVKRVARRTESQGGGTGALVRNLETAAAARLKRQAKAKATATVNAQLAEQDRQRREAEQAQVVTGEDRKKLIRETLDRLR